MLGLLTCITATAAKPQRRAAPSAVLLPDNSGPIKRLLLHFADYDIIPTLYGVLRNLGPAMRLTIAVPKGERAKLLETLLREWKPAGADRVNVVTLDEPMTFWIRDEFAAARNQTIVMPKRYGLRDIPESIEKLSTSMQLKAVHSLLEFDGGNVVVSPEHVFVGYNLIQANLGTLFDSEADIVGYLKQLFGRNIIVVGNAKTPVPHEHIDMYLTPLSGGRLLLGDPRLAAQLLEKNRKLLGGTYGKNYFDEKTVPLPETVKKLLFATPDFVERLNNDLGVRRPADVGKDDDVTLALLYARNNLPKNLKLFDDIADDLRRQGFKSIYRVPILMNHDIENGPFITYNNMLIDAAPIGDKRRDRVLMPRYNIAPFDTAARQTLSDLGYDVIPIDVQNISFYNGTLRCITQVLARD